MAAAPARAAPAPGLAILRTPRLFITGVASWQALARCIRLVGLAAMLTAFGLPLTPATVLLVMAAQGGGRLLPLAPASAGLRLAMLSYGFVEVTGEAVDIAAITAFTVGVGAVHGAISLAVALAVLPAELGTRSPTRAVAAARAVLAALARAGARRGRPTRRPPRPSAPRSGRRAPRLRSHGRTASIQALGWSRCGWWPPRSSTRSSHSGRRRSAARAKSTGTWWSSRAWTTRTGAVTACVSASKPAGRAARRTSEPSVPALPTPPGPVERAAPHVLADEGRPVAGVVGNRGRGAALVARGREEAAGEHERP